ncbi:MAG: CAP domain-containing protein [Deltaproteobacteria bacterium]|nr:CAP domain-containing protein [Deltaproteobacteria bacterium]
MRFSGFLIVSLLFFIVFGCDDSSESAVCGDNILQSGEQCDGTAEIEETCESLGFYGGTISCSSRCNLDTALCETAGYCGDNILQTEHEDCEMNIFADVSCSELGLGDGQLGCNTNCTFNTDNCSIQPECGNSEIEGTEDCDMNELNNKTCELLGFEGGVLSCKSNCEFDTSNCTGTLMCGDGIASEGEECDLDDLRDNSCELSEYYGGILSCDSSCNLDFSDCISNGRCGDGVIQDTWGEECDGNSLGSNTCISEGFMGGSISCSNTCTLDTSACGDNEIEIVCSRWNQDRMDLSEGTWSGNTASCDEGDISDSGRANALKLVNLYRFLADLPPVTTDPNLDAKAQLCALMMTSNNQLNHFPPESWSCYTADGATAAGSSNLAGTAGVSAVDLYMVDPGNPTTMGHRRWILSNSFGPTGLGSTNSYSCMWAFGNSSAGKQWTAYPPPGIFPHGAVGPTWTTIDSTGWTFQSDSINLTGVTVTVTRDGDTVLPVTVTHLGANYGSSYAISMIPDGWTTQAGHSYTVELSNISTPVQYTVEVTDCTAY